MNISLQSDFCLFLLFAYKAKHVIAHLVLEFDLAAQHEPQVIDGLTTVVVVAIMLVYTISIANIVFE